MNRFQYAQNDLDTLRGHYGRVLPPVEVMEKRRKPMVFAAVVTSTISGINDVFVDSTDITDKRMVNTLENLRSLTAALESYMHQMNMETDQG